MMTSPAGRLPGFGPGTFLAPGIVTYADANKDGRLSPDEAAAASERFLRDADSKKTGSLDNDALVAAINRRMRPPGRLWSRRPRRPRGADGAGAQTGQAI